MNGPLAELVATEHRTYVTVHDGDTVVFDADVPDDKNALRTDLAIAVLEGSGWRVTSTWASEPGRPGEYVWTARVEEVTS